MLKNDVLQILRDAGVAPADVPALMAPVPDEGTEKGLAEALQDSITALRYDIDQRVRNWIHAALNPPAAEPTLEETAVESLFGSSVLPAVVKITPVLEVQLGEIVQRAHEASGLSVQAWNALADNKRDLMLNATIDAMRHEAAPFDGAALVFQADGPQPVEPSTEPAPEVPVETPQADGEKPFAQEE